MKHWLLIVILGLLLPTHNIIKAQNNVKQWGFVNKKNGEERTLAQGQKLAVFWVGKRGLDLSLGKLVDIMEDSLSLAIKWSVVTIAKKDITKIKVKRNRSNKQTVGGFLMIVGGILIAGFFFLGQSISNASRLDVQLAAHDYELLWPWAFLGIGMIIWGNVILKSPNQRISRPFGEDWSIKEISIKPNKMP